MTARCVRRDTPQEFPHCRCLAWAGALVLVALLAPAHVDAQIVALCPQDGELLRPEPGDFGELSAHDPSPRDYCWRNVGELAQVSWPAGTTELDLAELHALVTTRLMPVVEASITEYSRVYATSPGGIIAENGTRPLRIGLFTEVLAGDAAFGGFHRRNPSRIYLGLDLDAIAGDATSWGKLFEYTVAHEMFHAFQSLAAGGENYGAQRDWVIEGTPNFFARRIVPDVWMVDPRMYGYHFAMRGWRQNLAKGLLEMSYDAHLYWHWLAQSGREEQVERTVRRFAATRSPTAAIDALQLPDHWHEFARATLQWGPWNPVEDEPAFPSAGELWRQEPAAILEMEADSTVSEPLVLPPASVQRVRILLAESARFVDIGIDWPDARQDPAHPGPTPVQASVALTAGDTSLDLTIGARQRICFDADAPACDGVTIHARSGVLDLIVSNWSSTIAAETRVDASNHPIDHRVTAYREGDRSLPIIGRLSVRGTGPTRWRIEAERMWFGLDDAVYSALIPDDPPGTETTVSSAFVREYVKQRAHFKGWVELDVVPDESRQPAELDGMTWSPALATIASQGGFYATPHFFIVDFDEAVYQALGGALGLGGLAFQRQLLDINQTRFDDGSFAWRMQLRFYRAITLSMPEGGRSKIWVATDAEGRMLLRMPEVTLVLEPAATDAAR